MPTEPNELAKEVQRKLKHLKEKRKPWESLWQDIADYVVPHRRDILQTAPHGEQQDVKIYNSKAIEALDLFADGLHGYMISPALQWFKLRMAKKALNDNSEIKAWLEQVEEQIYFSLARSNFYHEMRMYLEDGGSIGTAIMYTEEDIGSGKIIFHSTPTGQCCIEENRYREVDLVYREYKKTARQLIQQFGRDKVGDKVLQVHKTNPYKEFDICHAVGPRSEDQREQGKRDGANKEFYSYWVLKQGTRLLKNSGFDSNPYATWRFKKSGDEVYGRSPASSALAEIVSLNLISKDLLASSEMFVNPPMNIPAKMQGQYDLTPGGANFYSDPKKIITRINATGDFPVGIDREEKIERSIEKHFKVDFFLMLANSQREMTATEIIEKQGEKAALLGAAIGRLNSEALDPLLDKVFDIEMDAGRLPPPPQILLDSGGEIDIVYQGPLAQAQRRLFQTQGITRGLETIMPIMEIRPEIADIYDWDRIAEELGDAHGMPEKVKNDQNTILQIRSARQAAQQQLQAQEALPQLVEAGKGMAEMEAAGGSSITEQLAAGLPQLQGQV